MDLSLPWVPSEHCFSRALYLVLNRCACVCEFSFLSYSLSSSEQNFVLLCILYTASCMVLNNNTDPSP